MLWYLYVMIFLLFLILFLGGLLQMPLQPCLYPQVQTLVPVGNHRYDLSLYFFFLHSLPQVMLFSNILTHLLPRKPLKFSIIRLLNPYETVTLYQHLPQRGAISNSYPFFRMEPTRNLASPHLF